MINPLDFEELVERKIDFITTDTIFRIWGNADLYKKYTGFQELSTRNSLFIAFKYYASHEDIERVKQLTLNEGAAKFAKRFCMFGEKFGSEALEYSNLIRKQNWTEKNTTDLFNVLKTFDEKALKIIAFTWPTHPIALAIEYELRRIVEEKLKDKTQIDNEIIVLTFPTKENTPVIENRELMKIALEIQTSKEQGKTYADLSKEIKEKLGRHLEKFGFLGARGAGLKRWSLEDVFERASEIAKDPKLKEKLEKNKLEASENSKETEKIESELNFTKEERELVDVAKELVYFRTYRTEVMYHIYSDIENLLQEIGKRFRYNLEEMQYLSTGEVLELEHKKPSRSLIAERQKGFSIVYSNGKFSELLGTDRENLEKLFEEKITASELRGTVACKGKIIGKAKIVLTAAELSKVEMGDILVTNMTTPDFVPAMQRAAAFVTNEGGITCHAAIVSRELKKPCIIGTKVATKAFKDGDLVEVDAVNGIVKKLS